MKKLLSLIIVFFLAICAFADDGIFVEGKISKENATNTVDLMIETSKKIQAIGSYIYFPKGVKPVSIVSTCDVPVGYNYIPSDKDGENYLIISYLPITGDQYIWPTTGPTCVGKITVEIDDDFVPGNYEVVCCRVELSDEGGTINPEDGYGDLIVQKTAVIEPLTDGYSLEVLPFIAKEGNSTIDVLFKSAATAKSVTFDIELPQGMMFYNEEDFSSSTPTLNTSVCTKAPTVTLISSDETPNVASVSVMGTNTGAAALRKYINKLDELTTLVSIPVYVVPADNIEEWGEEYELKEGVYTAKLNNIVVTDYASNATFTGNYIASVIAGQPSAQEAILYGNYNEATASTFTTALKNVAIADVTAATVDEGVKFTDVLVNEKGGNSYYTRTSANYGTTVLPLNLTTANVDKLYTVESMDAESIVIAEAESVPANTPCIFKGTINVEGATPVLGVPSEQIAGAATFKGTYETTSIAAGAGYYISSNGCFYNDGASVRPFRGYFEGTVSGAKALQVLLEDETGIKDITDQFSTEEIYNLMGVKMNNANKGVNIINGKKVYIK